MRTRWTLALAVVGTVVATSPLVAHHDWLVDQTTQFTIQGTVTAFTWANPHVMIALDVQADGTTEKWKIGGSSPQFMTTCGWDKKTLKPGGLRYAVQELNSTTATISGTLCGAEETVMSRRTVTAILMGIVLSATVVLGQSKSWSVPRMPDGHPDFQGVWANNGMTPLERPKQFGLRTTMTDAELADLKAKATKMMDGGDAFFADELFTAAIEGKTKFSSSDTQVGNYDQSWLSDRVWDNRTSLIIDPPDGRIPPAAPGAAERARAQAAARQGRGPADSAADLSLGTRCVSYGTPNIRAGYQSYFEITQGPGVMALRSEMIHDVRIFSTDKTKHVSPVIRQYHGDSHARWDGDTFVVETSNYVPNATRVGASEKLRTTEKFRRVAQDTLEYYVTFDDPAVWSRPWTLMIPLKMTGEKMFEYACHEGNYGLPAILRGARELERNSTR